MTNHNVLPQPTDAMFVHPETVNSLRAEVDRLKRAGQIVTEPGNGRLVRVDKGATEPPVYMRPGDIGGVGLVPAESGVFPVRPGQMAAERIPGQSTEQTAKSMLSAVLTDALDRRGL